jgi:alkanesulfonate monooxygenase SsuD/methylene tetrahydromethanopterin reductase-like flavin-dependent oxidoreductase (luciferase family)
VTVKELEDLASLAEELDFDSAWTLDRIVVPESPSPSMTSSV